jgi:protein phosphatase
MKPLTIPEFCLVVLIGTSGSGKSTFASKHFKATEVLSSDFCRGLVSDDENDQAATNDAFAVLNFIAAKRLAAGKLTVVDATNVQEESRRELINLARTYHCFAVAMVLDLPESVCHSRNAARSDRKFGPHVVRRQHSMLRKSLRGLEREGFRYVHILSSEEQISQATVERTTLWTNKKHEHGPFDIIGDVHGCFDELRDLVETLGYKIETTENGEPTAAHAGGRKAVFLGDLVDRGPKTPEVLRLVMNMVRQGSALCVPGNHDVKLMKKLKGRDVQITHGLKESLEQLATESDQAKNEISRFIDGLVSHLVLDDGKLVVAHAGLKQAFQGRTSNAVREFALYGETTGETDDYGLPVRYNWAQDYRGDAHVVYGHTPVVQPEWLNKTICIDTGCVYGGNLTALRYPEMDLVSVPAGRMYYEPIKPLGRADQIQQREQDEMLDIDDVMGKRVVSTRLRSNITIAEQNAMAAIEVMSRFAVDPRWLIYLPPTMSPCETSREPGYLEHPAQVFEYFRKQRVDKVVCEEKHMGSRAIVIVCCDENTALKRFGIGGVSGICYTRTGRRFFNDFALESKFIGHVRTAVSDAGLWDELETDWLLLDCELMPWSAKAQDLLRQQYAAVGAAANISLSRVVSHLELAAERQSGATGLLTRFKERLDLAGKYRGAYRRYCWSVADLSGLKLAPFHLLASEGKTYFDKDHTWHMDTLARMCASDDELLIATPYKVIDTRDDASVREGIDWWHELTSKGGEGMVTKPLDFIAHHANRMVQPAVKCRGQEYLRIIYGPEYTLPEHLDRLRSRGLGAKRSLADREFALCVEAVERFVRREPLYKVHECVFGVLALESEPVDPRL